MLGCVVQTEQQPRFTTTTASINMQIWNFFFLRLFFGSRPLLPSCYGLSSNLEDNCDPDREVRKTIRREMLMFDLETLCLISDSEEEMIFFSEGGGDILSRQRTERSIKHHIRLFYDSLTTVSLRCDPTFSGRMRSRSGSGERH